MTREIADAGDDAPADEAGHDESEVVESRRAQVDRRRDDRPVLPPSTRDDTDVGWGERPADNDTWLQEQRPPHWD